MKFKIKVEKEVEASTLQVRGKVSDRCSYTLTDQKGLEIVEHDGYCPIWLAHAMGQDGDGDHLFFDINLMTGQIVGWKQPSDADLQEWVDNIQPERD